MSYNLERRNNALAVNPSILNGRTADISSTVRGSDVYFAICAIMGTTAVAILALSAKKPREDRIFFYMTAALNSTACVAYFAMGSNLGFAPIGVEFIRSNPVVAGLYREVFYARYIDWVITTPLLLMDLMLTAALPWPTILWTIFLDWVMIITGLIGALVTTRYKFGFFAIGCAAMFGIFYELAGNGRAHAKRLGSDVYRCYFSCGVITLVLWTLYPICWGLSEGGNVIAPDSEAVFYGVLDVIAKPVFSAALIYGHWSIAPSRLGLQIREFAYEDHSHNEKSVQPRAVNDTVPVTAVNNASDATSSSGTSTGYNGAAIGTGSGTSGDDHNAHTRGLAPVHERTTYEGGLHTATAHPSGRETV